MSGLCGVRRRLADEPIPIGRSQHREPGAGHLRADRGRQRDCLLALAELFSRPAHLHPVSLPDPHWRWFSYFHPALRAHVASENDVGPCSAHTAYESQSPAVSESKIKDLVENYKMTEPRDYQ